MLNSLLRMRGLWSTLLQQLNRSPVLNSLLRMRRLTLLEVCTLMEVLSSAQMWMPDCRECWACNLSRISLGDQSQLRELNCVSLQG